MGRDVVGFSLHMVLYHKITMKFNLIQASFWILMMLYSIAYFLNSFHLSSFPFDDLNHHQGKSKYVVQIQCLGEESETIRLIDVILLLPIKYQRSFGAI